MYFPEDTTYAVLFWELVCLNYINLIKIVTITLEKIAILCLGAPVKGPYFWK
jgi:hypothetical protein